MATVRNEIHEPPTRTAYDVVRADSHAELVRLVNLALKAGWRCQGGVCVFDADTTYCYCQAIVKEVTD